MASFKKRVEQIKSAEHDVDVVLKAARLQRHPMGKDRLELILQYICYMMGIVAFLIAFCVYFYLLTTVR